MNFHGIEFQARREALNISQDDMAKVLGIQQNTLSQWENGARTPRDPQSVMDTLEGLEQIFLDMVDRYFDAGENAIELSDMVLCRSRDDYERACPELAAQGIPWKLHRNAVAHAHMALRAEGYEVATYAG